MISGLVEIVRCPMIDKQSLLPIRSPSGQRSQPQHPLHRLLYAKLVTE